MARVFKPPFLFTGKLGDISGSIRDGKQYIRRLPGKRKRKPTPIQRTMQKRFTYATKLSRSIRQLVNSTWTMHDRKKKKAASLAMTHVFRDVVTRSHPTVRILWEQLMLSRGILGLLHSVNVVPVPDKLVYTWKTGKDILHNSTDKLVLILYVPSLWRCIVFYPEATRHSGYAIFDTSMIAKERVYAYICLLSKDEKNSSNSQYLGKIKLI